MYYFLSYEEEKHVSPRGFRSPRPGTRDSTGPPPAAHSATRPGVSVSTLRALEAGEPGVSVGSLAMALLSLGVLSRLDDLGDAGQDDIALLMDIDALPQRVRLQKSRAVTEERSELPVPSEPKGILL